MTLAKPAPTHRCSGGRDVDGVVPSLPLPPSPCSLCGEAAWAAAAPERGLAPCNPHTNTAE